MDLVIEGTEEQADCVCNALGVPIGEFIEKTVTPLCRSEGINVSWTVYKHKPQ